MNYKRKREIKTEPEDHVSDNIKAIPKDFVFGGNRGAVWGRKPFYECSLCQAELSSEQTVVDHLFLPSAWPSSDIMMECYEEI